MANVCPYYETNYKQCNLDGYYGKNPDVSHKKKYCLTISYWKECTSYTRSDYDRKVSKKVRPNPDL